MKFTYSSGQRPLDGYTIKRGIGQGGFGEVYFAVSDGGKEVALKLAPRQPRGRAARRRPVPQPQAPQPRRTSTTCAPTASGDHWVVMEYVAGEPLNAVLGRHPERPAAELARAVVPGAWPRPSATCTTTASSTATSSRPTSSSRTASSRSATTACPSSSAAASARPRRRASAPSTTWPRRSRTGNYNKQIDIYAAGVILYEMLTGQVPFDGESAGEILMKHLTSPPDLTPLPKEYNALAEVLHKNPHERYQNFNVLAEAVAGAAGQTVAKSLPKPMPVPFAPVAQRIDPRDTPTAADRTAQYRRKP